MLHIIWSIIVGFIIGWLAQALYPGAQHLGFWKAAPPLVDRVKLVFATELNCSFQSS